MPRYEYECSNGHKALLKFPFAENLPPSELYCNGQKWQVGERPMCGKMLKRQYSTFIFKMS